MSDHTPTSSMYFDEAYFFGGAEKTQAMGNKHFILIIYDISENKRRYRMAKLLESYGFRVQKSVFEALISQRKYKKLLKEIEKIPAAEDSVRVYKIQGRGTVENFGKPFSIPVEEVIIV